MLEPQITTHLDRDRVEISTASSNILLFASCIIYQLEQLRHTCTHSWISKYCSRKTSDVQACRVPFPVLGFLLPFLPFEALTLLLLVVLSASLSSFRFRDALAFDCFESPITTDGSTAAEFVIWMSASGDVVTCAARPLPLPPPRPRPRARPPATRPPRAVSIGRCEDKLLIVQRF